MKKQEFKAKITSPLIWVNLLLMLLFVVGAVYGTLRWLDYYTLHGEVITVPVVKKMPLQEAKQKLIEQGLNPVIADSGYISTLPQGCILEQSPVAGSEVKSGRVIYLTINSRTSPTIALPDIADNSSYREARARLTTMGFKLGNSEFINGDKDWVYAIKLNNREIRAGYRVPVGATIILVVGNGSDSQQELDDEESEWSDDTLHGDEVEIDLNE